MSGKNKQTACGVKRVFNYMLAHNRAGFTLVELTERFPAKDIESVLRMSRVVERSGRMFIKG
jgi:hypothetical protein